MASEVDREADNVFRDRELRREILAMLIFDRKFLRRVGDRVKATDFDPGESGESFAAVVAEAALKYWTLYRTPVSHSLGTELTRWARETGVGRKQRQAIAKYTRRLRKQYHPDRVDAVLAEVREYQDRMVRGQAIRELVALQQSGELTNERWLDIMQSALGQWDTERMADWVAELEARNARRREIRWKRAPITFIEPLDAMVKSIGRGHLGLWVGPYKSGKSLALIWLSAAYLFQGLNVLFITLEDPLEDVEDRIDACVSEVRVNFLAYRVPELEKRIGSFTDQIRTRLQIWDGTEGGVTVARIAGVWERLRSGGFDADVVLVDYDDEIQPPRKWRDRRHEFADIYRDLRQFAARNSILVWTAAQATREAEGRTIVRGKDVAEDISKIRKVTLAIGIGACDEWDAEPGEPGHAKTLYVAAHRNDRQGLSCRIWSDPARGMFYDPDRTRKWLKLEAVAEETGETDV